MTVKDAIGVMRAPDHLVFGVGQRKALADYVVALGRSALLVTDERMAADPEFGKMRSAILAQGVAIDVFAGVEPELPIACVKEAAKAGKAVDVVVGIGGGSCLDAAKCTALLAQHGGSPSDYYGEYKVPGPIHPVIAVPTTAGTGSEVTPVAVVDDPERALKVGISSPYLIPAVAICDPELTLSCPPGLTAASGADALTHAIEAFTALRRPADGRLSVDHVFVGKNTFSDMHALEAIRLIGGHLVRAVENGSDLEARTQVMLGSTLAGLAFGAAGTAAAHAIQYPVGALTHTAHGLGVATLLPYVMNWNQPACGDTYVAVGRALGFSGSCTPDAAIAAVADLFDRIGIPKTLAELGVSADSQAEVVRLSLSVERLIKNNPRPLDEKGMVELVGDALQGRRTRHAIGERAE